VSEESVLGPATIVLGPTLSLVLEGSKRTWGEPLVQPDVRRLYIRPTGSAEPAEAIQWGGRHWFKVPSAELEDIGLEAIDLESLDLAKAKKGGVQLNGRRLRDLFFDAVSKESAKGRLLRGVIALACGDVDLAKEEFEAGGELKKIPVELHWFLGNYASTKKATKEHLDAYIKGTKGKGPFVKQAEKLLKKK
jgi:hypothetical protein